MEHVVVVMNVLVVSKIKLRMVLMIGVLRKTILITIIVTISIIGSGCGSTGGGGGRMDPAECRTSCSMESSCNVAVCQFNNKIYIEAHKNPNLRVDPPKCSCITITDGDNVSSTNSGGASGGGNTSGVNTQARGPTIEERRKQMEEDNERWRQEVEARFAEYERALPTGTSSVTSTTGGQNIGNPQVNNLATNNGVVIPASPRQAGQGSRSQGTGAQRTGGNVTFRPGQTTRDDQSANPNAANNTDSRAQGAGGQRVGGNTNAASQQTTSGQNQPVQTTQTMSPPGTNVARVATTPQQTPQLQAATTIAQHTPPPTPRPTPTPSPVRETYIVQGIDWLDPEARIPDRNGNFKVKEAIYLPSWDIYHIPTRTEIDNIIRMARALQNVRNTYGNSMTITSWLRPTNVDPALLESGRLKRAPDATYSGASSRARRDGDQTPHPARGADYNKWVGGAAGSLHITGLAADVSARNHLFLNFLIERQNLLASNSLWMQNETQTRVGTETGYIHLDLGSQGREGEGGERYRIFRAR